jgi:hypothetical protein
MNEMLMDLTDISSNILVPSPVKPGLGKIHEQLISYYGENSNITQMTGAFSNWMEDNLEG